MFKIAISTLAMVLPLSAAFAQDNNSSEVDLTRLTINSPGTVGAMDTVVRGIATSPEDVVLQQEGHRTASEGAGQVREGALVSAVGHSAGTVGATPGNTPAN